MFNRNQIGFPSAVWHDEPYFNQSSEKLYSRDFYDRDIKAEILANFRSTEHMPVIIQGERRIGKTSLFRLVADHLKRDQDCRFVVTLLQYHSIIGYEMLVKEILQSLEAKIGTGLPDLNQRCRQAECQFDLRTATGAIEGIRYMLTPNFEGTLVIGIDEIDSALEQIPAGEASQILGLIHTLVQAVNLPVRLLLTLTRSVDKLSGAPLIPGAKIFNLHPFTQEDLGQMVEGLAEKTVFSPFPLDRLYELSGGWPYFAKLLLAYLDNQRGNNWLERSCEAAVSDLGVAEALEAIFRYHFNDNEKALVLLLAKREGCISASEVTSVDISLRAAAADLEKRHFVQRHEDGSYSFLIGFLAYWFPQWYKFDLQVEKYLDTKQGV